MNTKHCNNEYNTIKKIIIILNYSESNLILYRAIRDSQRAFFMSLIVKVSQEKKTFFFMLPVSYKLISLHTTFFFSSPQALHPSLSPVNGERVTLRIPTSGETVCT